MKKVWNVLLLIIVGALLYSVGFTIYENERVKGLIKDFKNEAVLDVKNSTETRKYYVVTADFEVLEPTYLIGDDGKLLPGNIGDILVSIDSPLQNVPFITKFLSSYYGGHAAIVSGKDELIEIAGYPFENEKMSDYIFHKGNKDENGVYEHDLVGATASRVNNFFLNPAYRSIYDKDYKNFGTYYRKRFIGLRVKAPMEERMMAVDYASDIVDKKALYNFLFFLDTKEKYYCTDLMSRSYQSIEDDQGKKKYTLNDDGFITSVNDLILSKDTYISFYCEIDDDNIEHIYYLDWKK